MRFARRVAIIAMSIVGGWFGCANVGAAPAPTKTCGQTASDKLPEDRNKACLAATRGLAAMRRGKLILRMDDDSRKVFDNGKSSDDSLGYKLFDFRSDTHVFVVANVGIDNSEFVRIDGRTGAEMKCGFAYPDASPDGNWLFTIRGHVNDGTGPDVAVYDARGTSIEKVWSKTANEAELPVDTDIVGWDDETTVRLSTGKGPRFVTHGTDGLWHIVEHAPNDAAPKAEASSGAADRPPSNWSCRVGPQSSNVDMRNRTCLARAGRYASEKGDTLVLRMDDGSTRSFKDTDLSGELGYGYALIDFYPAAHLFVVGQMGVERTVYTVVDGRTGRETDFAHVEPFFSPQGDVFASISETSDTYKFELKTVAGSVIAIAEQGKTKMPYGIVNVIWTGNDTARLIDFHNKEVILARGTDKTWHVEEAPAEPPREASKANVALKPAPAKEIARCGVAGENTSYSAYGACALLLGARVEKDDAENTLTLILANGESRVFAGAGTAMSLATTYSTYDLEAYSHDAHAFILKFAVMRDRGEPTATTETRFQAVDSTNGRVRPFLTFPYVAPHGDTALTIGADGRLELYDMQGAWARIIWSWPDAGATGKATTDTAFLGWVDDATVRVLQDHARVLTLTRGGDGWRAESAPLQPAYDVTRASTVCKAGPAEPKDFASVEAICLGVLSGIAERRGKILNLRLEDGDTKRLISVDRGGDTILEYSLVGFYPAAHAFVVHLQAYESRDDVIVDSITGRETSLETFPVFAPDARHFAIATFGSDGGVEPDISIFDAGPAPHRAWGYTRKIADTSTEPEVLGWSTNARVDLKVEGQVVSVAAGVDGKWAIVATKSTRSLAEEPSPQK